MAMQNRFLERDIPYGKLAKLGISKEETLSMPKDLLETFFKWQGNAAYSGSCQIAEWDDVRNPIKATAYPGQNWQHQVDDLSCKKGYGERYCPE